MFVGVPKSFYQRNVSIQPNSAAKQPLQVPSPVHHTKDLHAIIFYAVHNHVFPNGQAAVSGAEISFPGTSEIRKARQREKTVGDGLNQAVGGREATAFSGDVIPNVIEIGWGA